MKVNISQTDPSKAKLQALIVITGKFKPGNPSHWRSFSPALARLCKEADPQKTFSGKEGSVLLLPTLGRISPPLLALVGTGDSRDPSVILRSIGKAIRQLCHQGVRSIGVTGTRLPLPIHQVILAAEEGSYFFTSFKSPENPLTRKSLEQIVLFGRSISTSEVNQAVHISQAVRQARTLANQPPNLFHPDTLADAAKKLARSSRLRCKIWEVPQLKREGFGGILAVGQGSCHPPRFIRLDYHGGSRNQAPYVIVGKAITFDTGGISIKPSDKMDEMKFDKCGGIAVLGILQAVAALRLPINVTGLISSAENMPSGEAYRPGDLVKTLSGKYAEILNTDAEGRVVLCDALTFAQRLKPKAIVDLATLTGAVIVCFGHECAGILGNHQGLVDQLLGASTRTGEKAWQLPIWPEYQEKVRSDVGFVKNTAGREGGTITAACFLNAFVDPKVPWAHIDIAGTAWTSTAQPHREKGASAFGVRLVTEWLRSRK